MDGMCLLFDIFQIVHACGKRRRRKMRLSSVIYRRVMTI